MNNHFEKAMEQIPLELKLILQIITSKQDFSNLDYSQDEMNGMDWDLFLELVLHHRLYPLLYIKAKQLSRIIPSNILQILKNYYTNNTIEMLKLSSEMNIISNVLNENKIKNIFLKGPILGKELYGDLSLRTSCDLDFLIPIEELFRAEDLIRRLGYVKDDYINPILGDWKWRHHHISFFHPEKNIKIEVHWRLSPGPGFEPSFLQLWNRKRESVFTGQPINYLGKEDLFLFLVSHGARHGWSRLRWLIDINQIMQQNIEWFHLRNLLKSFGLFDIGGQAILLCSKLLNTKVTKEMSSIIINERPKKLANEAM
jgi:hypothetical protein